MEDVHLLDVVTPATSQDLVALTDVRDELGSPRAQDARLRRYITAASAVIATHTRRVWIQETVTETFYASYFSAGWRGWSGGWGWRWQPYRRSDGKPTPIVLTRYPVSSVTSVVVGPDDLDDPATPSDPSTYLLDGPKGLLYRWDGDMLVPVTWGIDTVTVNYVAGYALADVPPDVQQACMTTIRQRYFSYKRDPYLRSIVVPGVQEETYWAGPDQSALPPEAVGLLAQHIDMRM